MAKINILRDARPDHRGDFSVMPGRMQVLYEST